MRAIRLAAGLVAATALAPATAGAQAVVQAETVWRFDATSYTIDQGGSVLLRNADALSPGPHNVTAGGMGADGKPLFASKSIANGEEAPVEGTQRLTTGSYDFICTVHPFMQATLLVTEMGTPAPGGQPPGGPPSPTATGDRTAPSVLARIHGTTLRAALRRRGFRVTVGADEPASLRLRLTAKLGGRTVRVGDVRLSIERRSTDVTVRIGSTARRALRRARRASLALAVEARDPSGNVGAGAAKRSVRR